METLKLRLDGTKVPVVLEGEGKAENYELREMSAAHRDRYLESLSKRVKLDAAGKPSGLNSFDGMQADLLGFCVFDNGGKAVPREVIQGWPASVVVALHRAAQEINHLQTDGGEPKKDGQ